MNIKLPPEQEQWLSARVADGEFASPEAAVQQMIADRMALEVDDFAWARPYLDEARAAVARGEVMSLDDAIADIDAHLASLKG
jgi:antitoxin ParD1/3/4